MRIPLSVPFGFARSKGRPAIALLTVVLTVIIINAPALAAVFPGLQTVSQNHHRIKPHLFIGSRRPVGRLPAAIAAIRLVMRPGVIIDFWFTADRPRFVTTATIKRVDNTPTLVIPMMNWW